MDETDDGLGAKWDEISTKPVVYYLVIPGLRAGQWLVLVGYDDQEEKCESPMNERRGTSRAEGELPNTIEHLILSLVVSMTCSD